MAQRRTLQKIKAPVTPEECSSTLEHLLYTLRIHQKSKEKLIDSIFYDTAKMFIDYFDFSHRYQDPEYDDIMIEMEKLADKILKNKPKTSQLYIAFFESILKVAPPSKQCKDCGFKFHPTEDDRKMCTYCM